MDTVELPGTTRAEAVAKHVRDVITSQHLRPGDLIGTKTTIREAVSVAKATMNEAVRLLESQGVVTVRPGPGGGLFVARHDPVVRLGQSLLKVGSEPVSVSDAVIVRELLEPQIIVDAARHRTDDDVDAVTAQVTAMAGLVDDPQSFLRAVWDLHRLLAGITPNRLLRETYLSMLAFIDAETVEVGSADDDAAHRRYKRSRLRLHQRIAKAVVAGDVEAAAELARQHAVTNVVT